MRYRINRQQFLWFTLTATADRIMHDLKPLISPDEYLEIFIRLDAIIQTKKKVIGYRGRRKPKEFVRPQKPQREVCKIL